MMLLAQAQQSTGNGGILAPFVIIFGWIIRAIYDGLAEWESIMSVYVLFYLHWFLN